MGKLLVGSPGGVNTLMEEVCGTCPCATLLVTQGGSGTAASGRCGSPACSALPGCIVLCHGLASHNHDSRDGGIGMAGARAGGGAGLAAPWPTRGAQQPPLPLSPSNNSPASLLARQGMPPTLCNRRRVLWPLVSECAGLPPCPAGADAPPDPAAGHRARRAQRGRAVQRGRRRVQQLREVHRARD